MNHEKEITHIDLFSGIGGFTLAGEWAGFKTIVFCEKEEFCQKILQKRFGAVITNSKHLRKLQSERGKQKKRGWIGNRPILVPEIRDFDGTKWRGATLLTGGFPCQPFSVAGKRRGKEDDRYLWPQMRRIISEAKPRWILAENVPGIFHMALDTVLSDLESEGYTTGTFIIPACGLNAPHRRNRIWIIANYDEQRLEGTITEGKTRSQRCSSKFLNDAPDSEGRLIRGIRNKGQTERPQNSDELFGDSHGLSWEKNWPEIATQFCRMDDGVPDRIHRLKALGNAIVPQIAHEILKNIAWIENELAI